MGKEEDVQRNYQSTLHYYDYVIGDGHGRVDRRQGIRLGEPGVEILEIFRPKEPIKEKPMAKKRADTQLNDAGERAFDCTLYPTNARTLCARRTQPGIL